MPHKTVVDFKQILQVIELELEPLCQRKNLSIEKFFDGAPLSCERPCTCLGEEGHLKTLFRNLIKNALEAAPPGSSVTINARITEHFELDIHNLGEVPAEIRGKFFERYSTSGKPGGTGLGTYSAMLIVRAHGGKIGFTTSGEAGTHLVLRLPAAPRLPARLG